MAERKARQGRGNQEMRHRQKQALMQTNFVNISAGG
jgi:hypothetical protein